VEIIFSLNYAQRWPRIDDRREVMGLHICAVAVTYPAINPPRYLTTSQGLTVYYTY
jgi:hypothetical protein